MLNKHYHLYIKIIIIYLSSLIYVNAQYNLVELNPDFNYASWYKSETGYTTNAQWFGAWVIAPKEDELYFGFATARPAESDGALLAKWVGEWLIPIGQFSEQGVHCIQWIDDTLYGIGSDPSIGDGWDGGNFYKYYLNSGELIKVRYNPQNKPVLPNVLHSWGLNYDKTNNKLYMSTGSYDPPRYSKNGNDCGSQFDSTIACFGEIWQSVDNGSSWYLNSGGKSNVISTNRVYDIIKYNSNLFITESELNNTNFLKRSIDDGITWIEFDGLNPSPLFRMCIFNNMLVVAANIARTIYVIDENNSVRTLSLPGVLNYSFNVFANVDDKYLITYFSDGSVHATYDLEKWMELIPATGRNFLSIAYWEHEKSIILAERGDTSSIWKLNITELLNTDVETSSQPNIYFSSDNQSIIINSINDEILSVDIIDVLGNQLSVPLNSNSFNVKVDISKFNTGLYLVSYRSGINYYYRKIIKY